MFFLKEYLRNKTKKQILKSQKLIGFSDLLSYLMLVDDNTVLHKDGALSKHFIYQGPDLASSTPTELSFHASSWQQALGFLGNGWMVETNVLGQPFNQYNEPSEFPEIVSAIIDDERRTQFQDSQYFKSTYYLTLTFKPEKMMESKLRRFAIADGANELPAGFETTIEEMNRAVNEFVGFLKRSVSITPLAGDDLTSFLHQCISGSNYGLKKPYLGAFLDTYLSINDFIGGMSPKIGDKFIKVLALDDLPTHSYPCILDALSSLPIEYRWSSRFISLEKMTAQSYLKRYARSWSSKAIGMLGVLKESFGFAVKLDEDAQATVNRILDAQTENLAGHIAYGFYSSNLILMHEDESHLKNIAEQLSHTIQQLNFRVRIEHVNATESYLGSIPVHGDYNLRKLFIDTQFVSQALPTSSLYQGEASCPCKLYGDNQPPLLYTATTGSRPFSFNFHIGDVGHTAILGPTGMGKTTLISTVIASHRKYEGSRIIVMDKDNSNRFLIKALNGAYFDLSKTDCQFSPLARIKAFDEKQINIAIDWLSHIVKVQGIKITPEQTRLLREAVERLAYEEPQYRNLNHLSIQDPTLREAISTFNAGLYRDLLNGTEPAFNNSDIMAFEMSSLVKTDSGGSEFPNLVIKAIFNELDELFQDKRPTLLILEEAWLYLRHGMFREKLTDWFKTLRKANVAVIFVSQDLSDIVKSSAASIIRSSCMTRIYLPNKSASEMYSDYDSFGLNEQQIKIIQQATPKQDYYYQSEKGHRLFRLDLNTLAQHFLCVDKKADLDYFDSIYQKDDPAWILAWLTHHNLHEWHDWVRDYYFGGKHEKNAA